MDIETIKNNYNGFSTEKLISLVSEIRSLRPEFLPILQNELINRKENEIALSITKYLTSIKYHISDDLIFDNILKYRKLGLSEIEITSKIKSENNIPTDYIQLILTSLKEKGKENIINGILLIIIPLILGVILIIKEDVIGVVPLIVIVKGIFVLNKGIIQRK